MSHATTETKPLSGQSITWQRFWPALTAGILGLIILYFAGFAPLEAHNAAHDARHSAAFPCH